MPSGAPNPKVVKANRRPLDSTGTQSHAAVVAMRGVGQAASLVPLRSLPGKLQTAPGSSAASSRHGVAEASIRAMVERDRRFPPAPEVSYSAHAGPRHAPFPT